MRLTNLLRTTVSAAVVGVCAFGIAGAASAQQAPQDQPTTIDDIIVTAQKREQNLQDVPIVVTSLSQEVLQNAGVHDIKDLQILTPGLTVTSTTTEASTTARIRGSRCRSGSITAWTGYHVGSRNGASTSTSAPRATAGPTSSVLKPIAIT